MNFDYHNTEYLRLADQIQNAQQTINSRLNDLRQLWPDTPISWWQILNNRPYRVSYPFLDGYKATYAESNPYDKETRPRQFEEWNQGNMAAYCHSKDEHYRSYTY